uniref:Uncharacterized protein n=1 Tax=Rhodnius prolixus TaxID=13249 RepID=T1HFM0_RHOPR
MYRVGKKRDYRRKNRTKIQEFFDPGLQIFQKTPVTVLEELFPKRAVYSWAVARNYGCADLFRCRVTVPNCTGPPTDEQSQRRSRSCSRARGRSPFHGSDKFGGGCQMACAPMGETNAVKCLEEECKLSGIPAPEYSPHFQGRTGEWVVVAKLGPFTSKGIPI